MKLKHWKLGLIAALFSGSLYAAPLEVVSSFSILGDVAKQVGGERVNVSNLVGPDQDAHAYNLTSRDMQRIRNAKLVLVNGLGFEQAAVMRGIRQSGVPFAEATKNIQPMKAEDHDDDDHDHDHDHGHGGPGDGNGGISNSGVVEHLPGDRVLRPVPPGPGRGSALSRALPEHRHTVALPAHAHHRDRYRGSQ